jgi:formyltetrahydrofolate deformylase
VAISNAMPPKTENIVAAISGLLHEKGANITQSDQYSTDPEGGRFFLRMVFHLEDLPGALEELGDDFGERVGEPFAMRWRLQPVVVPKRVAILVSREDHCMLDLLWRWRRREIDDMEIGLVISNHRDVEDAVLGFGVPFEHVPVAPETKAAAEARQLELLGGRFDLVVLARYMQILSGEMLERLGLPVINIHHSFLPAFAGSAPYEQAKERGVKLIGATAHYVTEELDAGPIIEQDVIPVSHRDDVRSLSRLGSDIERSVLARAVAKHCEDRVLVDGGSTVVF